VNSPHLNLPLWPPNLSSSQELSDFGYNSRGGSDELPGSF
jgi:hypothetical protein